MVGCNILITGHILWVYIHPISHHSLTGATFESTLKVKAIINLLHWGPIVHDKRGATTLNVGSHRLLIVDNFCEHTKSVDDYIYWIGNLLYSS